jgi:predicted O-methyltransferase YrrM
LKGDGDMKKLSDIIFETAEMSIADHRLISKVIEEYSPHKILECGVSAGGTTAMLLEKMPKTSNLFSVDILQKYSRDSSKPVGFVAEDLFGNDRRWTRYYGVDISTCIEQIGGVIDFVLLDTMHTLPGELLSFFCILPFMSEISHIFIHDIALHVRDKISKGRKSKAYACSLLYNAIFSNKKILSDDDIPNSGIIEINRDYVIKNIYPVIDMLFMDWSYIPSTFIMSKTENYVKKYYSRTNADIFSKAIHYNMKLNQTAVNNNFFSTLRAKLKSK